MQTTTHYALQKPEANDTFNPMAVIDANMDTIDSQMYANAQAAANAQSAASAASAPNAATDTVIGNRTADPTQAPNGLTGTLTQFLSWITNRIKAITGTANWYDAPPTTLTAANAHMTSTNNPHNVTAAQVGAVSTTDPVYTHTARTDQVNTFTGNQTAPQFISNVAQGTAPLQVASTTVVQNLNSQLWDGANRTSAAAAPSNPNPGDEWYNTSTNRKLYWNGTAWVDPLKYQ